uniref:Uncharacterized protein n=1 Tax=Anguilla anguilla TaxID=7936 RepID=A0A0E9PKR7_ANGAN
MTSPALGKAVLCLKREKADEGVRWIEG